MLGTDSRIGLFEPQGAFYVFPNVESLLDSKYPTSADLATGLIDDAGIAVVPGESFGAPGHIRLSYALSDTDLERGVQRILDMFARV